MWTKGEQREYKLSSCSFLIIVQSVIKSRGEEVKSNSKNKPQPDSTKG
jgi:hypothetical protein